MIAPIAADEQEGHGPVRQNTRNLLHALTLEIAVKQHQIALRLIDQGQRIGHGRSLPDDMAARIQSGLDPAGVDGNGTSYASQYGAIARSGDLTLFQGTASNGSIRTIGGGDIQLLVPAGRTTIGAEGIVPVTGTNVAPAGLVTQGSGNIQLYSSGSILLGLSRIMTTYGGDITAWSAQGDINAGRGAKTTVVYTPLLRTYDASGNVALSPNVPATGAGVSVQAPVPDVPAGDVDLIAPEGTIDAGEAGIRASGNVNVAALQVVNAANIQAQGDTAGVPVVAAINVGALTAASSAATSAASAAQDAVRASQGAARQSLPSIISVQVLGFGPDGSDSGSGNRPAVTPAPGPQTRARPQYDASLPMRVVGLGANVDASTLTAEEQRLLKQDR